MAKNRKNTWQALNDEEYGERDARREHEEHEEYQNYDSNENPEIFRRGLHNPIDEILQLNSADHPGMILVPSQLNGNNFLNWSKSIRRAIGARSKLELLDDSLPQPEIQSPYYNSWIKVDFMVFSWIINSISKEFAGGFNHIDSTAKLWSALNHRFNRRNGPKIARLQREINAYVQGNQSVLAYFTNLTALWNDLDMILPPSKCVCDARNSAVEREENQRLMQFLNGLNDGYDTARNQILFLEPLPNIDRAYSMIVQVEDQKIMTDSFIDVSGGQTAMNIGQSSQNKGASYGKQYQFKGRKIKQEKMSLYCPHSNRNGHEEKDCFKLHGFPDWYKKMKESKGKVKVNMAESSSEGDRNLSEAEGADHHGNIGRMIQSEITKCMEQWMNKGLTSSQQKFAANMIHNEAYTQEEFGGHYAFSVLDSMKKDQWLIDSGASTHILQS